MNDTRNVLHLGLTLIMAWLGALLALPADTFSTNPAFRVMAQIGPETCWAYAFWLVATVGFISLVSANGMLRTVSSVLLGTAHGVVATCTFLGNPVGTGTGTYAVLAGMSYYLTYRRLRGR